ncbi:LysR family transcriptional regulator [Methylobacillus flagellatus]|uniref:LysR family transcriptional regulator n=1 Tax=Methylobacillus flagellatus TaxID=405 RepID=UPI002853EC1F|nr:LysR family transcriptional regulator [Methylobacillus flagellatus]MDR5171999.1 LysR family transcriptional regulator [Methylobacillus flagellatus]
MLNRLEMMRIFCATAEASSFKEAAARLSISPQAVTRAVKELESLLGEPLFYRNTRQIRITEFGEQLALRGRDAISGVDDLFMTSGKRQERDIGGVVRITAPVVIGRRFLQPILSRIAREHPHITIDLRLSDMHSDVVEQQIDIGVRVGLLRDSSFVARSLAKVSFLVVATPELAARAGTPQQLEDLHHVPTIALVDKSSGKNWPWFFADGQQINPRQASFITDDSDSEVSLALDGVGFAQIGAPLVIPQLESGELVSVLDDFVAPAWDLNVYRPRRGPVPERIRLVYDEIVQALSDPAHFPTQR